ncbi:MAG TPA: OB-fold nucleic acid binding domain-containing protein, partial [Chitinophagaceae bacterium]|nr:OB-fold nucleic acid binding domain-containing protein [Chitinophagaceae bacterium]
FKGFAVNDKGEIRFGLGGLKGVGEAAVESIILERKKKGPYQTAFDLIKRINQRTVNKKTLESLVYAGAFDCFTDIHRAQYFHVPQDDIVNGLERIIKYGQVMQSQAASSANTLFGDLPLSFEIPPPRLPDCTVWPLTVQLEHEKEVTGMFLSGHPLDHYRFEMKHYKVTPIADFNEFRESIRMQPNPGRMFRVIGLVADAQHKISRQGNKYGNFVIEDYSGKTELILFSEDYLKLTPLLLQGNTVFITGFFRPRYNREEFEFKVAHVSLVETLKRNLTKQVNIEVNPNDVNEDMIQFMSKNLKDYPGKSTLKFVLSEPGKKMKISLVTMDNGFEMNDELIHFLESKPELDVQVVTG